MKRSCKYCGRIHDTKINCGKKPSYKKDERHTTFRNSGAWNRMRNFIRERDNYLCQYCITEGKYNFNQLEIHHIVSLKDDWNLRLEESNLIAICRHHHEKAEKKIIKVAELKNIIKTKYPPGK